MSKRLPTFVGKRRGEGMKISSLSLLFLVSILGSILNGQAEGLLPMAKPEAVGLDPKKLEAVNKKMEALIEDNRLTGGTVVIARKGKVAYFETYGLRNREEELPVEKDTIFRIYSMTKAITSMAALMLAEEDKLELNDPLSKFSTPKKDEGMEGWKSGRYREGSNGGGFTEAYFRADLWMDVEQADPRGPALRRGVGP